MSQSAAIFGPDNDIPPLSGGVSCDYCRIAPGQTYCWKPVRLAKSELWSRLVSTYPDLASLGRLRHIEVTERTPSGRPVFLRLTGSNGATFDMLAERFRLAIGGSEIRSTDFELRVAADHVTFRNGRGFGHGLGLCQWGAQGQAVQGKRTAEILRYYYPGSKLMRAY
jgi:stage II sporulation protein D